MSPMVENGIDCIDKYEDWFKGRRIGLITSPSGVNRQLESTISILHRKYGLSALYSPEHGVRGDREAGAVVDTYIDPYIHVPVYSLYRKDSKRFTGEMLEGVDTVVYDMQDVGTRYYTFIYSMLYAMEDCAGYGKEFIVLDRINPLGGTVVEGNVLQDGYRSFVGGYSLCMRYGLTIGEFATMAKAEADGSYDLKVVRCEGWQRDMLFQDTGRVWVMPSMGICSPDTALLYPGMCLFEGTNLSEGRGTTRPFEIMGAPFIDAQYLADAMNRKGIPGVVFRPVHFTPYASKYKGELCHGVQVHVVNPQEVRSVTVGISLLYEIHVAYPEQLEFLPPYKEGSRPFMDLLAGNDRLRGFPVSQQELLESYAADAAVFTERKQQYHLY